MKTALPDTPGAPTLGLHNSAIIADLCGIDAAKLEQNAVRWGSIITNAVV